MASELKTRITEAAAAVRARVQARAPGAPVAEIGVILGTGLGDLAHSLTAATVVPYADIPHFPASTVERATPANCTSARWPGAPWRS